MFKISENTALISESLVIADLSSGTKKSGFRIQVLNNCLEQLKARSVDTETAKICKDLIEQTINFSYSSITPEHKEELRSSFREYKEHFEQHRLEIKALREEIKAFKNS